MYPLPTGSLVPSATNFNAVSTVFQVMAGFPGDEEVRAVCCARVSSLPVPSGRGPPSESESEPRPACPAPCSATAAKIRYGARPGRRPPHNSSRFLLAANLTLPLCTCPRGPASHAPSPCPRSHCTALHAHVTVAACGLAGVLQRLDRAAPRLQRVAPRRRRERRRRVRLCEYAPLFSTLPVSVSRAFRQHTSYAPLRLALTPTG